MKNKQNSYNIVQILTLGTPFGKIKMMNNLVNYMKKIRSKNIMGYMKAESLTYIESNPWKKMRILKRDKSQHKEKNQEGILCLRLSILYQKIKDLQECRGQIKDKRKRQRKLLTTWNIKKNLENDHNGHWKKVLEKKNKGESNIDIIL